MSGVKRWDKGYEVVENSTPSLRKLEIMRMVPSEDGDWVAHVDHEAALQDEREKREAIEAAHEESMGIRVALRRTARQLRERAEKAEAALRKVEEERDQWKRAANGDRDGVLTYEHHLHVLRAVVAERDEAWSALHASQEEVERLRGVASALMEAMRALRYIEGQDVAGMDAHQRPADVASAALGFIARLFPDSDELDETAALSHPASTGSGEAETGVDGQRGDAAWGVASSAPSVSADLSPPETERCGGSGWIPNDDPDFRNGYLRACPGCSACADRLRDGAIEELAAALCMHHQRDEGERVPWGEVPEEAQEKFRHNARAVLSSVGFRAYLDSLTATQPDPLDALEKELERRAKCADKLRHLQHFRAWGNGNAYGLREAAQLVRKKQGKGADGG